MTGRIEALLVEDILDAADKIAEMVAEGRTEFDTSDRQRRAHGRHPA